VNKHLHLPYDASVDVARAQAVEQTLKQSAAVLTHTDILEIDCPNG
jgi:hypothetical protein